MEITVIGQKKAGVAAARVKRAATGALSFLSRTKAALAVVFVSESQMAGLNASYRGKRGSTDILSFASASDPDLGDIFISPVSAKKGAVLRKMTYEDYLDLLVVHGTLHLCGFDHERRADAQEMEKKERFILRKINVKRTKVKKQL